MTGAVPPDVRNGWTIYRHQIFNVTYAALTDEVERLRDADPKGFAAHPKAKILKRINDLILDEIPANPADEKFRQGNTLGASNKGWFRAKFLGRFRLFFRFDTKARIIIYCWVNDENSLRKEGAKTDPYAVFRDMLSSGHPPAGWSELLASVVGADKT